MAYIKCIAYLQALTIPKKFMQLEQLQRDAAKIKGNATESFLM